MSDKIEIIQGDGIPIPETDFSKMESDAFLDPHKYELQLEPCLSIGKYNYRGKVMPIHFGSYGDFSCIVGPSKSRKTFLKTALISAFFGGNSNWYFPDFRGHNPENKICIDLDTEQNRIHARYVSNRVREMVGVEYLPEYRSYALRKYDVADRKGFMEWLCNESEFKGQIGLMFVDGAADMVRNVNDLDESNLLVQSFLKLTEVYNMHICTILHKNSMGSKPTGHLGSAIMKKAETVAMLDKDSEWTHVKCDYGRNKEFDTFKFTLNDKYLPIESSAYDDYIMQQNVDIDDNDDQPF